MKLCKCNLEIKMSRIGKKEIIVPQGVKVELGDIITVSKDKHKLTCNVPKEITVKLQDNKLIVERKGETSKEKSLHGLTQRLLSNMIEGLVKPFTKTLAIHGIGFKAQVSGKVLTLNVGYSHPVNFDIPEDIVITYEPKANNIMISGFNKSKVGETAASIRRVRPPEPYKGTGIRYLNEKVRKKAGKAAATAGAAGGGGKK
jgi:large subunit ribosomal protein L6